MTRDAKYYLELIDKVIEEIGEEQVIQIVIDNEVAMTSTGKLLMGKRKHTYWVACIAHCMDFILQDIGKKSSVIKLITDAKKSDFFHVQP